MTDVPLKPVPTANGMFEYLYDAEGTRVAKGTISSFSCDTAHNGFSMTASYILGPGNEQLTELSWADNTAKAAHTNVFAAGQLIATYSFNNNSNATSPATIYFHLTDWLGTRRALADYTGELQQRCNSLPFGNGEDCPTIPTEHLFTGKERDSESGNDYFGARYFASSMGRWLSPDPLGMAFADPTDPQSLNRYAYVLNNPLIFTDPDGLDCMYTNNQSWNSVNVTVVRGDCKSDKDNGVFVDGTIDANSLHYSVDQSTGATSLGYNFTNNDDESKSGAGVTSLANLAPLNTDGQLAPSIQNQFIPQLAATSIGFNRALPVPCGSGTNFGANVDAGPFSFRFGWDANTSRGLRFSGSVRTSLRGGLQTSFGAKGMNLSNSASLAIPDTPFALTAGLNKGRVTNLGGAVAFGQGANGATSGFGSAQAGAYALTGNFQDGCRPW